MTETKTEAAQETKTTDAGTSYILLQKTVADDPAATTPGKPVWREIGGRSARSAEAAIRAYAATAGSTTPLVLVAIPARSWAPVKVTPKTTTVLEVEAVV